MSGSGYTRQSAANITSGQPVASTPVNNEFNQLVAAFSSSSGHAHDATTGNGPQLGPAALGTLSGASAGMVAATSSSAFAVRTITGTAGTITVTNGSGVSGNPTLTIDATYVGQSSITTLGTIATGVWHGTAVGTQYGGLGGNFVASTGAVSMVSGTTSVGVLAASAGGTGVNNSSNTITLAGAVNTAGSFTTSGAFAMTLTATGATNVTLPTSGTLVNSAVTTLSSLVSVGTITTGTWNGTAVDLAHGGTNANLSASNGGIFYSTSSAGAILAGTATAGQILRSGSSAAPSWSTATYPATTTASQILYSSSTNTVAGLATANSALLVTSSGGVPSLATAIPNGVTATTQSASDNSTKVATTAYVDAAVSASALNAYPVGSIYLNASSATNPGTLLGFGTWAAMGQGRMLIGVGTGTDINSNTLVVTAGATGGEYVHTLTTSEMPSHNHTINDPGHQHHITLGGGGGDTNGIQGNNGGPDGNTNVDSNTTGITTNTNGSGSAHNVTNPYIGVYIWKRTA